MVGIRPVSPGAHRFNLALWIRSLDIGELTDRAGIVGEGAPNCDLSVMFCRTMERAA